MKDKIEELKRFLKVSKAPIVFVGAGVSVRAGLPSWKMLLRDMAVNIKPHDELTAQQMERAISQGKLLQAADYYFMAEPENYLEKDKFDFIKSQFSEYKVDEVIGLFNLPINQYVTTNYDRLIFSGYAKKNGEDISEINLHDVSLRGASFRADAYVARIHGRIEVPEQLVLTGASFEKVKLSQDYIDYLLYLFSKRQVLFVGCSFLDPAIEAALSVVKARYQDDHAGRHLALVSEDADVPLVSKFRDLGVGFLRYSAANNYQELWDILGAIGDAPASGSVSLKKDPFEYTKRFFATCYARSRVGGGGSKSPLRQSVIEGVVSSLIVGAGPAGVSKGDIATSIMSEFNMPSADAVPAIDKSLADLVAEGEIAISKDGVYKFIGSSVNGHYQADINLLTDGAVNRFCVRESGKDILLYREVYDELFKVLILEHGWDLGAAYSSGTFSDPIDSLHILGGLKKAKDIDTNIQKSLSRAVDNLLSSPSSNEANVLVSLGRLAFALELTYQSSLSVIGGSAIPERIFLDSNVVMPMLVSGHPFKATYTKSIDALRRAATKQSKSLSICVYDGFLNEVISHRDAALRDYRAMGVKAFTEIVREATMYGAQNVNIFWGAYASAYADDASTSFEDFLKRVFPHRNESELAEHLRKNFNFSVFSQDEMLSGATQVFDGVLTVLQKAYSTGLTFKNKAPVVVSHDAVQLTRLFKDLNDGVRTLFITADKSLRMAVTDSKFSDVTVGMMSHVGLVQFVDLAFERVTDTRGFAKLLWGGYVSSNTQRVRDYLVSLALREHDAALSMELAELIDDVSEDVVHDLEKKGLNLASELTAEKRNALEILGEHEARFYEGMKQVMDSLRQRDG